MSVSFTSIKSQDLPVSGHSLGGSRDTDDLRRDRHSPRTDRSIVLLREALDEVPKSEGDACHWKSYGTYLGGPGEFDDSDGH